VEDHGSAELDRSGGCADAASVGTPDPESVAGTVARPLDGRETRPAPTATGERDLRLDAIERIDLVAVDAAVEAAVRSGESGPLRVLGYGEITLVLGWPTERPAVAVKRLPPFRDPAQFERYDALFAGYLAELERRGISVLPTRLRSTGEEEPHAYLVQPLVQRERMLNRVLLSAESTRGAALLAQVVAAVTGAVDGQMGLDAQVANWVVDGDHLSYLDLSTPLMRSQDSRDLLDLTLFLSIYPAALRPALRLIARDVMGQYHDPREVIVDVASNLVKERLERWLPALLAAANSRVSPPITEREVRSYFRRDRRLWLLMQRLRRADRAWQRHVRRRPYPFLLPPPYQYGPPELPEGDSP
jgi:Family of unknown function (DUF6206)